MTTIDLPEGFKLTPLKKIADHRGLVMHLMKSSTLKESRVNEVYFSVVFYHVVKAWKKHLKMTQNLAVPAGMIKLVCFDDRVHSKTKGQFFEFQLGRDNYTMLTIPPLIWYGFQGISENESLIVNFADMEHDPEEIERKDEKDKLFSNYVW